MNELLIANSHEEYHSDDGFLSSSQGKVASRSAHEFMTRYEPIGPYKALCNDPDEETDALTFGTLVHDRCLLNKKCWKGHDGRRKQGEDTMYVSRRLKTKGSVCQRDLVGCSLSVRQALRWIQSNYSSGDWFHERSVYTDVAYTDVMGERYEFDVKARPDILQVVGDKAILFDLKTTSDASEWSFLRDADKYQYPFSLAWYAMCLERIGIEVVDAYWIAVQKSSPWSWEIYQCDQAKLSNAAMDVDNSLVTVGRCRKYGWPGPRYEQKGIA